MIELKWKYEKRFGYDTFLVWAEDEKGNKYYITVKDKPHIKVECMSGLCPVKEEYIATNEIIKSEVEDGNK